MERLQYIQQLFGHEDNQLKSIRSTIIAKEMVDISVHPLIGKLLKLLVQISGAKNILEIGTLGGYSALCLAQGLTSEGRITTLEMSNKMVEVARKNITSAKMDKVIKVIEGKALDSLAQLAAQGESFDFFFIDADKGNYLNYLDWSLRLGKPGALIVADNVLSKDRVLDAQYESPSVKILREFNCRMAQDRRLESVLLPVCDGIVVARICGEN